MARIVLGIAAVIACFMMVDSLSCNKCPFSLLGVCLSTSTPTCGTNVTSCFTSKLTFPSIKAFTGFNTQGCLPTSDTTSCNKTMNSTLLAVTYKVETVCCETDTCNPITVTSDAPATKLTFTAAIGAALLASVWGSMQ